MSDYEKLPTLAEWVKWLENIDKHLGAADRWHIAHLVREQTDRLSVLERVAEAARGLVEMVARQEKALRGGFHNQYHVTAVAAASLRVEAALADLDAENA